MSRAKAQAFWDRHAQRYSRSVIADETSYREKLRLTQTFLKPDMRLLELGCGTGSTALDHAPFVRHILATDVSPAMIEIARSKAKAAGVDNVTFRQTAIETLVEPPASFDGVLALSVLHLVDDREAVLARIRDLLVPGGLFVSSTACLSDSVLRYLRFVLPAANRFGLLPPVAFFTADALVAEMESLGFEIIHRWTPAPRSATFVIARKRV